MSSSAPGDATTAREDDESESYWAQQARDLITWQRDFHTALDWQPPYAEWFVGGKLNVAENCLDRHLASGHADRVAFYWEGEPADRRVVTYGELHDEVCRLANALKAIGVERGDRVAIYLPRIPELPASMLACARIGAVHSVVFSGLSSDALADRINDATATALITADGGWIQRRFVPLKRQCDEALGGTRTIQNVIVVDRAGTDPPMQEGRDLWYHECVREASPECPAEAIDSEELLYLLYTSGATARPKGIMHTSGGYLTQVATTMRDVFAIRPGTDVFWCGIDPAWAGGHSYGVYGPLVSGVSSLLYEGALNIPTPHRIWELLSTYQVTHVYVSPTTVRMWMKWSPDGPANLDLSVRQAATYGETLHIEERDWLEHNVGDGGITVTNTWWQTESGAQMAASPTTPPHGVAVRPLPGLALDMVDESGSVAHDQAGVLTISKPWPAMLRGVWDQPKRYRADYWHGASGQFITGDYARLSGDDLTLLGRVDDLISTPAGPISPFEMESLLNRHAAVGESVMVSVPAQDETYPSVVAFVAVAPGAEASDELGAELAEYLEGELGVYGRPKTVVFTPEMPRTDDGKLMRRLLRDVADGREHGDTTALLDTSLMDEIRERASYPENWCWCAGPIEPGPVVIVDIDGTIADAQERMKGIEGAGENWLDFMVGAGDDALIVEVARLVELLTLDVAVVMLSARPISIQDETREWLARHNVRWDLLILRASSSMQKPLNYKQHRTEELRQHNFDPVLALEDDRRNVDMYRAQGVPCLYIHSGIHG